LQGGRKACANTLKKGRTAIFSIYYLRHTFASRASHRLEFHLLALHRR
jgi:hypothetical protein